jgi:hypothetical protein
MPYIDPQDKKMYLVVIFGAGMILLPIVGGAIPAVYPIFGPMAAICAVGFVLTWVGPAEKLFPLRTLPQRTAPALWSWILYVAKTVLFFGGVSLFLYLLLSILR